ncbi:MAG: NAD-dependent succinate-semialdehyde dehydrogenase [Planctomycetota bacterium]
MRSINPATGEPVAEYGDHDRDEIARRLALAERCFRAWRHAPFAERAAPMRRAAQLLRRDVARHARLMTLEMGKPIAAAEAEVEKCAAACEHFAEHAQHYLAPERIASDARESLVRYDPIGPVLALMPWNFPFWQLFRFAAPALMAGNVGLLKHASNVPGCALAIEAVFQEAGFPAGALSTLLVGAPAVADLIAHPVVRAVTLTGSEQAGAKVAAQAGAALKKTVLELGGSDPFVVLGDVDVDLIAQTAARARTINSGQSCIAAKRFIVVEPIVARFERSLARHMASFTVGDPMDRATDIGPLARADLVGSLHDQVQRSIRAGATLLVGGQRLDRPGFFYAPTVLAGVEPGMPAFDEETFGPVAAVVRARDVDHAIELANRSCFGLGASIWTGDSERGERLARDLEAGCVFVNGIVKSDPRLPFGGVKRSGYGRELAQVGTREFVNIKTVWVN